MEGEFLKLRKGSYKKPIANATLNDERMNTFSLKLEQVKDVLVTNPIQYTSVTKKERI